MQHPLDYERITIPPNDEVRVVCHNWPDCGCGDDCTHLVSGETPLVHRMLVALMIAVAAIGAGLIVWSFKL